MAGTVTPAQVNALKAVYPRLYKRMVDSAGRAINTANTTGNPFPMYQTEMLSILFSAPEMGVLSNSAVSAVRNALSSQGQPQGGGSVEQAKPKPSPSQEFLNA
jgi:hypothetical protein